jgi:hypothetical protein
MKRFVTAVAMTRLITKAVPLLLLVSPAATLAMTPAQAVEAVRFANGKSWMCAGRQTNGVTTSDVFRFVFSGDNTFHGVVATAVAINNEKYGQEAEVSGTYRHQGLRVIIEVEDFRVTLADRLPGDAYWINTGTYRMSLRYTVSDEVPYLLQGEKVDRNGVRTISYDYCRIMR